MGRYLRLRRPIRRGEALLVEEPLFLSPGSRAELEELLGQLCETNALILAAAAPTQGSQEGFPGGFGWLPVSEQICLVILQAQLAAPQSAKYEALRTLQGDPERWASPATRLWRLLREDIRAQVSLEELKEVYAIVANNAHGAERGQAGLFLIGSMAEHSCAPTAFKEVIAPVVASSRPGSPRVEDPQGAASFATTCAGRVREKPQRSPQLILRALHDMDADEVVSISYIPEYLPTYKRRSLLQANYGFICECDRCLRSPEVVCAYICPGCEDGPCSPTVPVASTTGDLTGLTLSCESCHAITSEEVVLSQFAAAECSEVVSAEFTQYFHPFHHKIFGMYLNNLKALPAAQRVEALEQLLDSQRRLTPGEVHPLLGKFSELMAIAYLEMGKHHEALAGFRHAEEHYGASHKGFPDVGHVKRCFDQEMQVLAGPLGPPPLHLTRGAVPGTCRPPSLPALPELGEDVEGDGEG